MADRLDKAVGILAIILLAEACGGTLRATDAPAKAAPPKAQVPVSPPTFAAGTFGDDLSFLDGQTRVVVLADGQSRVAVAPEYQGRVLTSSAGAESGRSFGWINREAIAKKERAPHMNVFGGEDRFWLGPEGGQFALYFRKGSPIDFDHWQVPEAFDWGAWPVTEQTPARVSFRKDMKLENFAGTVLELRVDRTVTLDSAAKVAERLGGSLPDGVSAVAFESSNTITNTGTTPWTKDKGLPSVWILGQFQPSERTTIVLPFRPGPAAELGPIVNDDYFGKVPESRLKTGNGVLFFRGDGRDRGKVGIPRPRARPVAGSWDAEHGVLTLVEYTLPDDAGPGYVNSKWEQHQRAPYGGDVVNSYNDGPPEPGKRPLGPFYEIETSSPAASLAPGQTLTHVHATMHLTGPRVALDAIAKQKLGVGLSEIEAAFGTS